MPRRMVSISRAYAAGESFIVMASAIRMWLTSRLDRAPDGNDERDQHHDEHGEVGVVLHVDNRCPEYPKFKYRRGKRYHRVFRKYQRESPTNSAASTRTMP